MSQNMSWAQIAGAVSAWEKVAVENPAAVAKAKQSGLSGRHKALLAALASAGLLGGAGYGAHQMGMLNMPEGGIGGMLPDKLKSMMPGGGGASTEGGAPAEAVPGGPGAGLGGTEVGSNTQPDPLSTSAIA